MFPNLLSTLFLQVVYIYLPILQPSLVKKTLHCLEAIHSTQSGALLTLLVDKFLMTSHLAVARLCDTIACRRVEMLLAETADESQQQLPLEDLKKLLQFMDANKLTQKSVYLFIYWCLLLRYLV